MKHSLYRWGIAVCTLLALAACGSDSGTTEPTPPPAATLQETIAAAAALAANDTASNNSAPFTVLQNAGVAAVTVNSPPKINFTVFSDGRVKTGLTVANVSMVIAKLVPGTGADPDQWVNYIYRKETATPGVGPGGKPALATAMQATADGKQSDPALLAAQFVYNADGYYTYTFKTDIKDLAQTNGVVFEPGRTHRIAIQLSYKNALGETVLVNPYFDFTVDASGNSVAVTDPAKTRKMTDIASCNGCHEKLALHGGGRVDTQLCVMCHNPGTTDANSGNNLNLSTMAHKIHSGKLLKANIAAGGEDYTIWGYRDTKASYAEVGFPQDLRNCSVCHSATNVSTPQGDNWKSKPSKEACLTCHANKTGSDWDTTHTVYAGTLVGSGAAATSMTNQMCADCHRPGSNLASERVHWNQNEENAAKYKMNLESVAFDSTARKVTVKYFLADPTNGNAAYNLVTPECIGTTTITCANTTKFGNLRFVLAYPNLVGRPSPVTEFTSYNNGGNTAVAYAYKGTNDGSNHYTVDIPLPPDSATAVAAGTARVVSIGQIKEPKLQVRWATDPRPEVVPRTLINTIAMNTYLEVPITGSLNPRRTVVTTAKCNVCHGALGTTSGSNTLSEAFHGGARNTVEACVVCHDVNRASTGNMMTNGLALYESFQFKRMIHGIHGNSKRSFPFTHGNKVVGAFNMDGTSATGGAPLAPDVENYAAEVAWPGVGINCNVCHVDNSYKTDKGPLGTMIFKPVGVTDPGLWNVISPKAASCTSCHDSPKAMAHVTSFGGATFGERAQVGDATHPAWTQETCDDCHASGGFKGVDIVHGQK